MTGEQRRGQKIILKSTPAKKKKYAEIAQSTRKKTRVSNVRHSVLRTTSVGLPLVGVWY